MTPTIEKGARGAHKPARAAYSDGAIHKLVDQHKVALPLHAEWNTEPNVVYVPPLSAFSVRPDGSIDESHRRIPLSYIESLFGAGAGLALRTLEQEMAKRSRGEKSEVMDTLIAYQWKELLGPFDRDPATITW